MPNSFKDFLIDVDISFFKMIINSKERNILFLVVKMYSYKNVTFGLITTPIAKSHFEANILYIILHLIIALRIMKFFYLIDKLNAIINKRLGLNVTANRVFGQNNLLTVREKQAVSQTRKWS